MSVAQELSAPCKPQIREPTNPMDLGQSPPQVTRPAAARWRRLLVIVQQIGLQLKAWTPFCLKNLGLVEGQKEAPLWLARSLSELCSFSFRLSRIDEKSSKRNYSKKTRFGQARPVMFQMLHKLWTRKATQHILQLWVSTWRPSQKEIETPRTLSAREQRCLVVYVPRSGLLQTLLSALHCNSYEKASR